MRLRNGKTTYVTFLPTIVDRLFSEIDAKLKEVEELRRRIDQITAVQLLRLRKY